MLFLNTAKSGVLNPVFEEDQTATLSDDVLSKDTTHDTGITHDCVVDMNEDAELGTSRNDVTSEDFFCERVFQLLDHAGTGCIRVTDLIVELDNLTNSTPEQTLQFIFNVYDTQGAGELTRDGLQHVLESCIKDSSLSLASEQIEELTDVLFDEACTQGTDTITFEGFKNQLDRHPDIRDNLSLSVIQWLKPKDTTIKRPRCPRYFTPLYIRNHVKKVLYLLLYIAVNVTLFVVTCRKYTSYNVYMQVARSCGQCLNFNCMWILVLMLRNSMTFLRSTKLRHILPLDQHIFFHKLTGYTIGIFALAHSIAHIANAAVLSGEEMSMSEILFTTKSQAGHGILTGSAYYTGWLLVIVLTPMIICSLSFIRQKGHFELFYLVHLLYIPFWILLILHGSSFWMWFLVPGTVFLLEKVFRSKVIKKARYGDMWIQEVNLLPSKVTHLVINRPVNFHYKPGDYIFIQIPVIAKYEWHPFTISSAPEMSDSPAILRQTFSTTFSRRSVRRKRRDTAEARVTNKAVNVKCYIDGPYGTCAREILKSEHAMLIGTGIGVTPMASILQSVWFRFSEAKVNCPSCRHVWYNEGENCDVKLKKVDFIWVNRDQKNFEWFLTLLNELELEQSLYQGPLTHTIETHLYMTSARRRTDLKGIGLQMALDLIHEKNKKDLITGLRAKTKPGRPDWNELFKKIQREKKGRVHVYFCGPATLGKSIKDIALKYDFEFSRETF